MIMNLRYILDSRTHNDQFKTFHVLDWSLLTFTQGLLNDESVPINDHLTRIAIWKHFLKLIPLCLYNAG